MNIVEFDYLTELERLEQLKQQNFKKWIKENQKLSQKTKFSLNEIKSSLEDEVCSLTKNQWSFDRIVYFDEQAKTLQIQYYMIDNDFASILRRFVRKDTTKEQEIGRNIQFLSENGFITFVAHKTIKNVDRSQIFQAIDTFESSEQNYFEKEFFTFEEPFDQLYYILINHINQKNNIQLTYTKKNH